MIGVYAHHHGSGHIQRALAVAAEIRDEVTILTSAPISADANPAPDRIRIVTLPLDHDGPGSTAGSAESAAAGGPTGPAEPAAPRDPTAGGRLHWAPLGHPGLRRRTALLTRWIDEAAPTVMWTDISVEVTLAARLTGTPVVTTVLPGRRDDPPHQLAHGVCSALVASWPRSVGAPVPAGAHRPLVPVGGISRFARRRPDLSSRGRGRPRILHLRGSGGTGGDTRWDAVRDALGAIDWVTLGGPDGRWVADPWDELCRADVVISAAGQSSIADLAAADAFVVVAPEERPFDEQDATAEHLARLGHCSVVGRDLSVGQLVRAVEEMLERSRSGDRVATGASAGMVGAAGTAGAAGGGSGGAGSGLREAWEVDGAAGRLASVLASVSANSLTNGSAR